MNSDLHAIDVDFNRGEREKLFRSRWRYRKHGDRDRTRARLIRAELGTVLKTILLKIETALDKPSYNYIIHTSPFDTQALPHYREFLAMYQKLYPPSKYPDGHPDLASSLSHLGVALQSLGQAEQGLPHIRDSPRVAA